MALKRVRMFARRISVNVRLVRSSVAFGQALLDPAGARRPASRPVGRGLLANFFELDRRDRFGHAPTLVLRAREWAPMAVAGPR